MLCIICLWISEELKNLELCCEMWIWRCESALINLTTMQKGAYLLNLDELELLILFLYLKTVRLSEAILIFFNWMLNNSWVKCIEGAGIFLELWDTVLFRYGSVYCLEHCKYFFHHVNMNRKTLLSFNPVLTLHSSWHFLHNALHWFNYWTSKKLLKN